MPAKLEGRENEHDGPANRLEAFALELRLSGKRPG